MARTLAALVVALVATAAVAGPGKKDADRAIADLRNSKDAKVRAAALKEIGKIGQVQKALIDSAVDDVVKSLEDKEADVRAEAAKCYGMIDPDPKQAIPALLKLAKNEKEDQKVRTAAVEGLGAMGAAAKPALPELNKLRTKDAAPGSKEQRFNNAINQAARVINGKR